MALSLNVVLTEKRIGFFEIFRDKLMSLPIYAIPSNFAILSVGFLLIE